MIDWFVLLIPLALIPIILMLAFVGCRQIAGLDEFVDADDAIDPYTVLFNYDPIDDENIDSIEVTWEGGIAYINEDLEPEVKGVEFILKPIVRDDSLASHPDIQHESGEYDIPEAGKIPRKSIYGNILCRCTIPGADPEEAFLSRPIEPNMPAPSFTLKPNTLGGFYLV